MNWIPYEHHVWYFEIEMIIKILQNIPEYYWKVSSLSTMFFLFWILFWKIWTNIIFLQNFSWKNFCKKKRNFISDHNALISVFENLICGHNFFTIYGKNNIGVFCLSILYEEWRMYLRQKAPRNFLVKGMTSHVAKKVIIIDM